MDGCIEKNFGRDQPNLDVLFCVCLDVLHPQLNDALTLNFELSTYTSEITSFQAEKVLIIISTAPTRVSTDLVLISQNKKE